MFRHREWIYDALRAQFPGCRFHAFADEHVQKQESFDFKPWNSAGTQASAPAIITEHGVKFRADPAGAHKTGFFADQRDNRQWLSRQVEGKRVLDLCCRSEESRVGNEWVRTCIYRRSPDVYKKKPHYTHKHT